MKKLNFSIVINSSVENVWNKMFDDETYKIWTEVFSPGSHYKGDWNEGSKILFLGPDSEGNMGGMVSRIKENRKHKFISIEHLGIVHNGKEITTGEEIKAWAGALENYTFVEKDSNTTEVFVEMDSNEEYAEMFDGMWPKALNKLKELSEK